MKKTTAPRNGQGPREDIAAASLAISSDGDRPATPDGTGAQPVAAGTGSGTGHRPAPDGAGRRRPLGELLLAEGAVTPDQLNRALEIHPATGERLGQGLPGMGGGGPEG